jgi:hypothetical protein
MKQLAQEIIDLYAQGLSGMDMPLLQRLIDLGDQAAEIISMCDQIDRMQSALVAAESFISGFEDDEMQEGIDELLAMLRAEMPLSALPPGTRILSIHGECDDGDAGPRSTGPNAIGTILEGGLIDGHYPVGFENGTSVFITPAELSDAEQYRVLVNEVQ